MRPPPETPRGGVGAYPPPPTTGGSLGWPYYPPPQYRPPPPPDALDACRRVRTVLADELGIDPGPALIELEQRVPFLPEQRTNIEWDHGGAVNHSRYNRATDFRPGRQRLPR
ncbi:BTAD domain-containing putative transcriptional regulator, partial [Nocardia cyriacigeorgica]|uniref:BTAD domain-containing putative transcriptional regulator n=1 Tax=Nocardia cyriacigeorgica TaxID=135487 RepID=UPI003CC7EABC